MTQASRSLKTILVNASVPEIEDDRRHPPNGFVALATYASQFGYDVAVHDLAGVPLEALLIDNRVAI